jgi:hypothetical protein
MESQGPVMIVDCMTCPVRGQRCDDCAVTVLRALGEDEDLASAELQLDAAENSVVSIFVSAGLVNPGAAARLRARPEKVQRWGTVRHVG